VVKAAKKRKKEEDEEFRFPEFDERDYLRKEVLLSKATFVTLGLAIPVAVLLYGLTVVQIPIVAFFVGMAATFSLPRIFRMLPWPKLDLEKFERKDWVGQGGTFFLAWLTVWVLLLNVPFADVTPPVIAGVTVSQRGTVTTVFSGSSYGVKNDTLWINSTVFENGARASVTVNITGNGTRTSSIVTGSPSTYALRIWIFNGTRTVTITAVDEVGLPATFQFYLNVV
jgi:hypothetical protein